jgi:hypothetical protein
MTTFASDESSQFSPGAKLRKKYWKYSIYWLRRLIGILNFLRESKVRSYLGGGTAGNRIDDKLLNMYT